MIYDYLTAHKNPELSTYTTKFTMAPRVKDSTRRFANISNEYRTQVESSIQNGAKVPRNINVIASVPGVNQWKRRPNIAKHSILSSIASSPGYFNNNNVADDEKMTATSGLTHGETPSVKTMLFQVTELQSKVAELTKRVDDANKLQQKENDSRKTILEKEQTDRENEEAARRLQRAKDQAKERAEREKEEAGRQEQRAQEKIQYRKQSEKDAEELRAKQVAVPSDMSDIKEFMTAQANETRALRQENETKQQQIQQ